MRDYRITVAANRYPTDFNVKATNWQTAASRGIREWREKFARENTGDVLTLRIIRGAEIKKVEV